MSFKSLETTFIYTNLNKNNALTTGITNLMTKGIRLSSKELEDSLMIISKNFKFPLKYKVIDAFTKGDIQLLYATNAKIPTCLPFVLTRTNKGNVVAIVAVSIYGTYDEETHNVSIDPKKLYCMMESAYLARLCYMHTAQLSNRTTVLSAGSDIYSMMFTRVLNKKYSLNIDKSKMHKVILLSSKFFMINQLGLPDNDLVFNYALKNCPNGNIYTLKEVNRLMEYEDYQNLETFIKALTSPKLGLNLKDLTVRNYLEAFINMYEASNLLSLESFPYFLYNIISVTNGAYINNQYVMEDIVGNNGSKIYNDLLNIDD